MKDNDVIPNNINNFKLIENVKDKSIVIDSCVLLYCEGYNFKLEIRNILRALVNNSNKLSISELSGFEVLKNSLPNNIKYFLRLIGYIDNIPVKKEISINAIILHNSYADKPVNNYQKISSVDYLIGGTTMYIKGLLLTCDKKAFLNPIWKIIVNFPILYRLNNEYKVLNFYLLEPNIQLINSIWKSRKK